MLSGQIAVSIDSDSPSYSSSLTLPQSQPFSTTSSAIAGKSGGLNQIISSDDDTVILSPGEYFGEESFILGIDKSSKSYMAVNEVTLCLVSKALFDDVEIFLPAKNFIINDLKVRNDEKLVHGIRKKRSSVRFCLHGDESSCRKVDTATSSVMHCVSSAKSFSPPGILLTATSGSILTDTDNSSNTDSNVTVDFVPVHTNEEDTELEYSDVENFFFCGVL